MKKNFIQITKITGLVAMTIIAVGAGAQGLEQAEVRSLNDETLSSVMPSTREGRALMNIEDMKVVLGLGARKPNADTELKNDSLSQVGFAVEMTPEQKQKVYSLIQKLERDRSELIAEIDADNFARKEELRKTRKEVHVARMSDRPGQNTKALGRTLFNSLVEESSLDSKIDRELALFDEANAITLDFVEFKGVRYVSNINIGMDIAWKADSKDQVWAMNR